MSEKRTYKSKDTVAFRKTREAYGGLSNMCVGYPITVNGYWIRTSEAAYQMCKHPLTESSTGSLLQEAIIMERSPMNAKKLAREYERFQRYDWMAVRVKVMRWALQMKFACNPKSFGDLLVSTGSKYIVEHSNKDMFWGARYNCTLDQFEGFNILGRLLMELRDWIQRGDPYHKLRIVEPPQIQHFLFLNDQIEPYHLNHIPSLLP